VFLIDFDRGRLRRPGRWRAANLQRLHRSLDKVCRQAHGAPLAEALWQALSAAYRKSPARS
jgi:3-deoxy-D-manno-octulosonic acid kinase